MTTDTSLGDHTSKQRTRLFSTWFDRFVGALAFAITVYGVYVALRTQEEISYRELVRYEAFPRDKDSNVLLLVAMKESGKKDPALLDQQVDFQGRTYGICNTDIDAIQLEILNTGNSALWYNDERCRPTDAKPFCIVFEPAASVVDVKQIPGQSGGDASPSGFSLLQDAEWGIGRIPFRWGRLLPGESIVVQVRYVRPAVEPVVSVTGELRESSAPMKLPPPDPLASHRLRVIAALVGISIMAVIVLLTSAAFVAVRRYRQDTALVKKKGSVTRQIILPFSAYWQGEFGRFLLLLLVVAGMLVISVVVVIWRI